MPFSFVFAVLILLAKLLHFSTEDELKIGSRALQLAYRNVGALIRIFYLSFQLDSRLPAEQAVILIYMVATTS